MSKPAKRAHPHDEECLPSKNKTDEYYSVVLNKDNVVKMSKSRIDKSKCFTSIRGGKDDIIHDEHVNV